MGKNVAVFVDVANIFYAAKAAGVDIDYVTLLKAATAGRDFVRAYAYTGLDPDNENQRNFHQFLARHQYKVVSKDIRKYGDGKVKANLDIELVVDMMKTARNLDIAVIVSGDGDFASAIRAVQEMGVRCEVISFRGNTSSDLIEVADLFTDITQIAKVDKSSTRSGRRVADDDEDLSMTEVPDKITEGTGRGRGGRGRGGHGREREEVAASSRGGRPARGPRYDAPRHDAPRYDEVAASASGASGGQLIALPGERLSRAVAVATPVVSGEEPEELDETTGAEVGAAEGGVAEGGQGEAGRRRRRRRGGRGRGRGRQEGDVVAEGGAAVPGEEDEEALAAEGAEAEGQAPAVIATESAARPERPARQERPARRTASGELPTPFDDMDVLSTSRARKPATPFGSVWDAQLGTTTRPATSGVAPLPAEDEDLDEPEIPEYLLAERRRGGQGQAGRGGRGGGGGRGGARGAYNAAIERERYGGSRGMPSTGGGGMGGGSRYAEPSRGGAGRGPQQPPRGGRSDRPDRVERAPRSGGDEPWSEVPPELEQILLAQMQRSRRDAPASTPARVQRGPAPAGEAAKADAGTAEAPKRRTTRRAAPAAEGASAGGSTTALVPTGETAVVPAAEAPTRRPTRRPAALAAEASTAAPAAPTAAAPEAFAATAEAPKRRTPRKAAPVTEAVAETPATAPAAEAPKRRTTRKPTAEAVAPEAPATASPAAATPAAETPKRRTATRKKAEPAEG